MAVNKRWIVNVTDCGSWSTHYFNTIEEAEAFKAGRVLRFDGESDRAGVVSISIHPYLETSAAPSDTHPPVGEDA